MPRSKSVLEVNHVSHDGDEVDLQLPGTNLQWFRVRTDTLNLPVSEGYVCFIDFDSRCPTLS
jgi:hypothetical protein